MPDDVYEKVFDLAKRRGFLYPAYELYGGAAGFYDYGPLGSQLKALLESKFRHLYVVEEGAAEIHTPAITIEPVLKASGHVDHFSDVVVTCKKCGSGFRADHFLPEEFERLRGLLRRATEKNPKAAASAAAPDIDATLEALARDIKERPTTETADHALAEFARLGAAQPLLAFKCPQCGANEVNPKSERFNLMFRTHVGPGSAKVAYLRPETAQAMFVDFPALYRYFREKLPFAACQIGRAYRNEISPRQGLIRLREFNQMEVEAFFDPKDKTHPGWKRAKGTVLNLVPNTTQQPTPMPIGDAVKKKIVANAALGYHLTLVQRLLTESGIDPARLRFRQHLKDEMAHYAADCWDAEYESARFGWVECVGVADRTDFDLRQHATHSGKPLVAVRRFEAPRTEERVLVVPNPSKLGPLFKKDAPRIAAALSALDAAHATEAGRDGAIEVQLDGATHRVPPDAYEVKRETVTVQGEEFVPHVIEPSFGADRILYGILEHSHRSTVKEGEAYTVLSLPHAMAPITVGVFPLMAKDGLDALAKKIEARLRAAGLRVQYDESGAIGRRYARADEVGTPFAVTIDYDSLKDKTVTLRDRDTTEQVRVLIPRLAKEIQRRLAAPSPSAARSLAPPVAAGSS